MLLPALRCYGRNRQIRLVFIEDPADDGRPLIGVFPLEFKSRFRGVLVPHLCTWRHEQQFLATPLVDAARAAEAWVQVLGWARTEGALFLNLPSLAADGAAIRGLEAATCAVRSLSLEHERFDRAVFEPAAPDAESYLRAALSARSLKSLRRDHRRLSETGEVRLNALDPGDAAGPWVERFLKLEASGWKGQLGTALACKPQGAKYFREICEAAHSRGRLMFLALCLDGRPVAMQCTILSASKGFGLHVAYDEELRRMSPGTLLEIEAIRHIYARGGDFWFDSCTGPDHSLMTRLWMGRRTICHRIVSAPSAQGRMALHSLALVRRLREAGKRMRMWRRPRAVPKDGG
jgi:CelD/BcsL family acetyltransferase involved in cellulose biosynthesis